MTSPASAVEEAVGLLLEFGCPICGEVVESVTVRTVRTIGLSPCDHAVAPEDATHMQRFYRELWFAELHTSVPEAGGSDPVGR